MKTLVLRSVLLNCDDGSLELCFAKRIVDDGVIEHEVPHRRVVDSDGDPDTEIDAVVTHLSSEGWNGDGAAMKGLAAKVNDVARQDAAIEAGRQRKIEAKRQAETRRAEAVSAAAKVKA